MSAAHTLTSLLLDGLSDQDLAVLARRLLPHLQEGQSDRIEAHSAYTVVSLAEELGVSAKVVRCHRAARVEGRQARVALDHSADAVSEWASATEVHRATTRRRPALPPAPKAAGPSLRSVLCGETLAARGGVRGGSR